jgi:hypothetical protein
MIIQDNDTTIEQIGTVTDEAQFKMKASRKAFQILSDLYSDKPLAIVRELGCNASDSMVAANKGNQPFLIHVPNSLEPWLTIQDFGTGIKHEDIYDIYAVYFASTKTNSNKQIGCLGLGSKSPFCYTDNFTITSIIGGEKRIYNAYFNAENMPTISLMSVDKTSENNGVAIQIPIKQCDFSDFSQAVYKSFRFFDVRPTIVGGKIEWDDEKPEFTGGFWKSYKNLNQSYAVMGGVTYPIDHYKMNHEHHEILRKAGLVISFGMGELDFVPSREALSYCPSTIKALNDKIEKVKIDFLVKVEETIKNSPNLLDALKALHLLHGQWSFLNSSMIKGKVMWKHIDITDPRKSICALAPMLKNVSKRKWGRKKFTESAYASLDNKAVWYYDNLPRGAYKRVIQFLKQNYDDVSVNLVSEDSMNNLVNAGFPADTFNKTSDLAPVNSNRASSGRVTRQGRLKGVINLFYISSDGNITCQAEQFDLAGSQPAPKYYVIKNTHDWYFDAGSFKKKNGQVLASFKNKDTLRKALEFVGIFSDDVRMVTERNAKHIEKLGSKSLKDVIDNTIVDYDADKLAEDDLIEFYNVQTISKHKLFKQLSDDNAFKQFINGALETIEYGKKFRVIRDFLQIPEKKSLTFTSNLTHLLYQSLECSYHMKDTMIDLVLKTALELDNNNNQN